MPNDAEKPKAESRKPKGMACAIVRAEADFAEGKSVVDCPYRGKAWKSCWAKRLAELQQQQIFD